MQPYVIKQGDYLDLLAHVFDFDADTVWNDPANDELRKRRPNPNMLCPTDILYIPTQAARRPVTHSLVTGQTNTFVSTPPTVDVSLKFADPNRASQAFTMPELGSLTGLATGADGSTTFKVPVTLKSFTVVFTSDGASFTCKTGHLDPISTLSGVAQRLQNLGYLDPAASYDLAKIDAIRRALSAFRYVQTGGSTPASGAGSTSAPSRASSDEDAGDDSDDGPDDDPDTAESQSPDSPPVDNVGLDDSGVLNDEMTKSLLKAHGS